MTKKDFIEEFTGLLAQLNKKDVPLNYLTHLKYENLPKSLFKYCSFDEGNHNLNNLKNNIVWMNNPLNFNDPYEFSFKVNLEEVLAREYHNKIDIFLDYFKDDFNLEEIKLIRKEYTTYDETIEQLLLNCKIIKEQLDDFESKYIGVINQSIENDDIKKLFKVSSFAEQNDLLLMWSHYAQNHTGFCVEYDIGSLDVDHPLTKSLYPIIYSDNLFDITEYYLHKSDEFPNLDYMIEGMITKSLEWKYEKEWRLLVIDDTENGIEFSMPKPKAIYLGSKFDIDNLKLVYSFCIDNKVDLYQMKLDNTSYKLIPNKLT
jgi:hypothetical protein